MKKKEQLTPETVLLANLVISAELNRKIKKLGKLMFMSIIGFSALGTYLVVKNNK